VAMPAVETLRATSLQKHGENYAEPPSSASDYSLDYQFFCRSKNNI
jgi:hypothetical protein